VSEQVAKLPAIDPCAAPSTLEEVIGFALDRPTAEELT
jgi:hypothetical protein